MNAGELSILISADLQRIDGQFRQVEQMAGAAGDRAAQRFVNAKQFLNIGSQLANAIGAGIEEGFRSGAEEGIKTFVSALPAIGPAFSAGLGAGEQLSRVITEYGRMEVTIEQRAITAAKARDDATRREQESRKEQQRIAETEVGNAELLRRIEIEGAKAAGDERKAARIEAEISADRIRRERDLAIANASGDREKRLIREQAELRLGLNAAELQDKYRQIRKGEQAESDRKKREEEALADKRLEDSRKLNEERVAAQQAGIVTGQTAIGAFTFDAYPAAAKARNDARIVQLLSSIAGNTARAGGFV